MRYHGYGMFVVLIQNWIESKSVFTHNHFVLHTRASSTSVLSKSNKMSNSGLDEAVLVYL